MVRIDNRTERPLSVPEKEVLEALFAGHDELIIKSEFNSGLTDSRVFLVRSVRSDGPELPSVVKIDHFERIQREWEAYQGCIRYRVPRVAEVRDQPVYPPGNPYGGLWYPLAEAGAADVQSLYDYLQRESIENCCKVLETQLFKSLENIWQHRKVRPEFHFQSSYDAFLPVNLFIEQGALQPEARVVHLYPDIVRERVVKAGDTVQLSGFRVVKLYRQEQRLSLDTPQDHPAAYRMHIQPVDNVTQYKVGQVVHEPFTGIVKKTRHDQLLKQAQKALGSGIDLKSQTLTLPNSISVPNPLVALPQTLNHSLDANIACIHGDLNLQNVLVNPENHTIYVIDFAKSGRDHVLRDLLQLEMSVVTTILAQALAQAMLAPERVCSFYQSLHEEIYAEKTVLAPAGLEKQFAILKAIRKAAQPYLFKPGNWAEYYHGLTIYLMGALKFESLDEQPLAAWRPKQVAFWGAAMVQKLLREQPAYDPQARARSMSEPSTPPVVEGRSQPQVGNRTNFYGPTSGPIHTGSGNIHMGGKQSYGGEAGSGRGVEPTGQQRPSGALDTTRLRQMIVDHFNDSELRSLCSDLGIDYENLAGSGKVDKVRELIGHCERRGRTAEMISACRRLRPHLTWPYFT